MMTLLEFKLRTLLQSLRGKINPLIRKNMMDADTKVILKLNWPSQSRMRMICFGDNALFVWQLSSNMVLNPFVWGINVIPPTKQFGTRIILILSFKILYKSNVKFFLELKLLSTNQTHFGWNIKFRVEENFYKYEYCYVKFGGKILIC